MASYVRRFIFRAEFDSARDEDVLNPSFFDQLGIPVHSVCFAGDRSATGPVQLWALVKLRKGARMCKAMIEAQVGVPVLIAAGDTKDEFETIERRCDAAGWGFDGAERVDTKAASVAPSNPSIEAVAGQLAASVQRILAEARPADEALRRENASLQDEIARLKAELRCVKAERDDYAVDCFELRGKLGMD